MMKLLMLACAEKLET